MKNGKHLVLVATLAGLPLAAAAQALVTERTLSMEAAKEAASAALERCRKDGYHVTVTVMNRAARTQVVLHDDGASPHTIENSMRKAYTSLTFGVPSGEYGKLITESRASAGALHLDKVTTLAGALPIFAGKELVGSIGVSGASGNKDTLCAKAGIDRIFKGLGG